MWSPDIMDGVARFSFSGLMGMLVREWIPVLVIAQVAAAIFTGGNLHDPFNARIVALAGITVLAAYLFLSHKNARSPKPISRDLLWCAGIAAGTGVVITVNSPASVNYTLALRLAMGVGALTFFLAGLHQLLFAAFREHRASRYGVIVTLCLTATAPLWLGPWVDLAGGERNMVNGIIGMSPLTYLATLADYDYLRSQWFYQHTPFGMFRFDYPSWAITTFLLFLFGMIFQGLGRHGPLLRTLLFSRTPGITTTTR